MWADDVHVDYENAINSAVRKLREVLVDTSENPRYVETLARRGYRFIAPVSRAQQASAVADVTPVETPAEIPQQAEARPISRKPPWLWLSGALVAIAAIGGTAFWIKHMQGGFQATDLQAVPLTAYPGYESSPSFSPDGNQIAFSWNGENGDNSDIYVKLIGSGRPLRLTTDPAQDVIPAWSPDGRSVAFKRLSSGNSSIRLIPALGGAEREVAQLGKDSSFSLIAGWSPDGRRLLISWADQAEDAAKLFWVSVETGEKQRLTSPPPGTVGDQWCSISPDGRTIAFARIQARALTGGIGDLYTLPLTSDLVPTGEPKRLTFDNVNVRQMAWTADSREIVFSSGRGGSPALWRISVSGSEKPRRLEVGENGTQPAIAVRSNRLVYVHQVPADTNIWRMDLSNPAVPAVSFIVSTRQETDPQYSPDGKRIVFASNRSGSTEIWECDADGSNPVQLTTRGLSGSPRWSPDSRQIAFDSSLDGRYQIFVMAANGGQQQQLTRSFINTRPNWSHDGKWLYFASNRTGRDEVWRMPSNGGTATQVTRNGGTNPVESADGAAIYYDSDRTIMKAAPDGSGEIRIVDAMVASSGRNFALTKEGIFYRTSVSDLGVWFLSFGDGKSRRILKTDKPLWAGLNVSPDGHWLLYTQYDRLAGSELMLVENFN